MKSLRLLQRLAGFTLLEMTVVLAISGLLGMAAWKFLPVLRSTTQGDPALTLQDTQAALEGFILREYRLPCPDTSGNGLEDCTSGVIVGRLPTRTLGISLPRPLRYGVYRSANAALAQDADLAVWKNRYLPMLPPGSSSLEKNGLDFCWALRNAIAAPAGSLAAGGIPVAYALADPGANGSFDDANATPTGFAPPNSPMTATYDDRVMTAGLGELSGRLDCPQRLGAVQGATRASFAAYDIDRNAQMYRRFRDFGYDVAKTNTAIAASNSALATADLAIAYDTGITTIAAALITKGTASTELAASTAVLIASTAALVAAGVKLASAIVAENTAYNKAQAAATTRIDTLLQSAQALTQALAADRKGLTP